MYCIASTVSPCPLPSHRLLHVCRCVTSCVKGSGNPKGAPHRWSSPLPPAPHTPPFLGSASGLSHGCPPTLHPPPGAPVGDPTAALHLPPSPAAPVGDPTAALQPPPLPKQRLWAIPRLHSFPLSSPAAPVGDPTAALPPPPPTTRPITPPAEWSSGQPHELLSGSRGFESLPSPRAPNLGNTCSIGSCTTRNCILPASITYLPTSAIVYIVLPVLYLRDPSPPTPAAHLQVLPLTEPGEREPRRCRAQVDLPPPCPCPCPYPQARQLAVWRSPHSP